MARWSGLALVWALLFLFALVRGYGDAAFDVLMVIAGASVAVTCYRRARA
jgi:hypothetical protein